MTDNNPSSLTPNPLMERMLRASSDGEKLVELQGYVGSSTPDAVRLYKDLSVSRYLEIPRDAIVHSSYEGDPTTGPLKLYVHGSTSIISAQNITASAASLAQHQKGVTLRFTTGHVECVYQDGELTCDYVTDLPE